MSVNPFLDPVFQAWVASKAKEVSALLVLPNTLEGLQVFLEIMSLDIRSLVTN